MNSSLPLSRELDAQAITDVFNGLFLSRYNTALLGGAEEPLYVPESPPKAHGQNPRPALDAKGAKGAKAARDATAERGQATIYFRADYAASALHEAAHWCIAGQERRCLQDYGYWYDPDGRSGEAQAAFLKVERRPQALEWCFSQAAGLQFRLSMDNLDAPPNPHASRRFACGVAEEVAELLRGGLPKRASLFFQGLARRRGVPLEPANLCCEVDVLL